MMIVTCMVSHNEMVVSNSNTNGYISLNKNTKVYFRILKNILIVNLFPLEETSDNTRLYWSKNVNLPF